MLVDGFYMCFFILDYVIVLYVSVGMEVGKVGCWSGYSLANVDMMDIMVYGQGGYGVYFYIIKDFVFLVFCIVVVL